MTTSPDAKPWPVMSLAEAHALMTAPGTQFEIEEITIRGVPTRVWKNAPATLRDLFLAGRAHGGKTFLVYEDDRATFESFSRAALAIAHALLRDGVKKGDRVAVAMRNLPEWPAAFFGAALTGAIVTPLNAWGQGAELEYALNDSGASVVFLDGERLDRLADGHLANCSALQRVYVTRDARTHVDARVHRLESITGTVNDWGRLPELPLPDVNLAPDDDATIFYTSGTTGAQKGALGTQRCTGTTVFAGLFSGQRVFIRKGEPVPDPAARTLQRASLVAIPFFHTTGCQSILAGALYGGSKLVTMHRWDVEQAMDLIEREQITVAGGVPTIAWQILEHPNRERYNLSTLESVAYGGAPASAELVRRIKQVFPTASPSSGWGMTETSATFTHHSGEDYVRKPDSAGPSIPVGELRIVGEQGETLPAGEVGELWAKGPHVVKGYWNKPEVSAETFTEGWVKTGDLAYLDDEGWLYIVDRKKDMLIRGGENIYCTEVEGVLYEHPAVMDASVVGLPHKQLGEEPGAAVTLKAGAEASEQELRAFVAERLARFKVPVRILVLDETLPRNANGKILKKEVKRLLGVA
ncbi:MAG: acyl--CoA ligase [Rhizobacter sp.]|nr:acyl--CoA ligase [Rhizobacter sp.]